MGDFYGSEYWTYTLPRRVGQKRALELTLSCPPMGTRAAREMGFLDHAFGEDAGAFVAELRERATRLAKDPEFRLMLRLKHEKRLDDEHVKPLASFEKVVAGHGRETGVNLALLAATNVVNPAPRNAAKYPKRLIVGVKQHFVGLEKIGAE
jgi:enoyl-CoA hydratase/carnithine racemase